MTVKYTKDNMYVSSYGKLIPPVKMARGNTMMEPIETWKKLIQYGWTAAAIVL
jgi:hypothetical protein